MLDCQTTLKKGVEFSGVGVHSGKPVRMSLLPAEADVGIVFSVINQESRDCIDIPANAGSIVSTDLCTVLGNREGVSVATVEHVMAALGACGVDNAIVELDAPEVPAMDGSAYAFVEAIQSVGVTVLDKRRCYIRIKESVRVDTGEAWGEFVPYDGTRFEIEIDFDCEAIGRQKFAADMNADVFEKELGKARTFGFVRDVRRLWSAGFALGSSLDNSVVIGDDGRVMNPEGLRYRDEFVRHKALDTIGDLALAGGQFLGCFRSYRGGHKLNSLVLKKLLSCREAFEFVGLPAYGGRVNRNELVAMSAPAYAANFI